MNLRSSKRGQGLLEAIIGIGVIIAGTVGTITLVVATIKAGRSTNNQVVAASLAREGIEVVRNLRDSNWLKIQANEETDSWRGLFDQSNRKHVTIPVFSVTLNTWTEQALPVNSDFDTDCVVSSDTWDCSQVFQSGNVYLQESTIVTVGRQPSRFKRLVTLNPICRVDGTPPSTIQSIESFLFVGSPPDGIPDIPATETIANIDGTTCASGELLVGLQVLSEVKWDEAGSAKSFALEDRLYNWKYVK